MAAGVGRLLAALIAALLAACGLVVLATAAIAQPVVPSSVQPGREQQRFTEPQPPLSQPRGPTVSPPSTVAPQGAEHILVKVRGVHITGATVYRSEALAPLYADMVGHEVTLAAIYDLAQRITTKYGNDG